MPVRILRSALRQGHYESAYLFSGPTGVGKTTIGRILAKTILCESPIDGNPCNTCNSCTQFQQDKHYGYKELDSATYGGKEDMVKLRDDAAFQSIGSRKVILLDECQDISPQGQDALLKQTEECPEHLVYIFCTTDPDKMKNTLRDRCREFQMSRVAAGSILKRLKDICEAEHIVYEENAIRFIAEECKGHVRNAINKLEDVTYIGAVNIDNVKEVSKNYDADVCDLICSLGSDIGKALSCAKKISSFISVYDFYQQMMSLLSDTAKLLYGYEDFIQERKNFLQRIKDVHGFRAIEFLDYLIKRDKYVDRIVLQSDIMLLHYKFSTNSFQPPVPTKQETPPSNIPVQNSTSEARKSELSHASLSKLSVEDRSRVLREQRKSHKEGAAEDSPPERIPVEWPLPKEQRLGENSFDDSELSPEEFSRLLVGGRGGI